MKKISIQILAIVVLVLNIFTAKSQKAPEGFIIKNSIKTSSVKNQNRTGTCWAFTTISFLETEALRLGKPEFDLSEMYVVNKAYEKKADLYVRRHGNASFSEGGQAHDVMNLIKIYGIVPEKIYKGNNYAETHDHAQMVKDMEEIVKKAATKEILDFNWHESFTNILNKYLGQTPETFTYEQKEYSPITFMNEALGINPDNYVEFTSYNHHLFYTKIDLELPDNWSHDEYYNVPVNELIQIMDSALVKGYSIAWDGDVSGEGFNNITSIAELTETDNAELKKMSMQDYRQKTFDNFTTYDDHLMHIVGIAYDKNGKKYYVTKNSWGEYNNYGGFLYMSENYVKLNTIAFMVNKEAVPEVFKSKICKH